MKGIFAVLVIIVTVYALGWWLLLIIGIIVIMAVLVMSEGNNKAEERPKTPTGKFVITQEPKEARKYNNLSNGGDVTEKIVFNTTHNNNSVASDDFEWKLKQKIKREGLISAVAFFKARTGYDLVSSKKYVEQFIEENNIKQR